jgi:septal ring factor EnvC (AmiA/AmiB activator)
MDNSTLYEIIALMVGTNGLTAFVVSLLTIRYERRKAKGEAHQAEYDGMKIEQDTYQELIADLKEARNEDKELIIQLKDNCRRLRAERDALDGVITEMKKEQREQGDKLARLARVVENMKLLLCVRADCKLREKNIMELITDESFSIEEKPETKKPKGRK